MTKDLKPERRKLRIGIVVDQLLTGGVQLAAIEQVKELNKLGHPTKLLILMRKKYPTDFLYLVKDVPHQFLSDSYPIFFRKTLKFPVFSFLSTLHLMSPVLAPQVIKEGDYDILISLGTATCLTTQAIYHARHIPYVAVIHDPIVYVLKKAYRKTVLHYFFPFLYPLARFLESSFVRDAERTIIISKVHYDYLKNNYGIIPEIHTFGTKTLQKLPPKRGNRLLAFGRWQNEKNPFFLLQLIKSLPKVQLTIAGSWLEEKELFAFKESVRKEKLEHQVTVVDHYDEEDLRVMCEEARLFLYPHFEAFGLAALEAAGHGLPIIMPQKSGVTEIFQHGVDGFFPANVDVSEYTHFITILLNDERQAYMMGVHAWKTVKDTFSWEANTKALLKVAQDVLIERTKIFVLETGHALGAPLAGGDKLMEPMALRLTKRYAFSIIVSSVGAQHWIDANLQREMIILKRNRFDESGRPVQLFLAYCIRMWQTYHVLKSKIKHYSIIAQGRKHEVIVYSSTNILPDVLPAYLIKKRFRYVRWIARVHHLIPPPAQREGNTLVNSVSYLMQRLSVYMMKSSADLTLALNVKLNVDLQRMGFDKEKLKVLGGGIEFEKIKRSCISKTVKYNAVFLGRLHRTKGVFDTVAIWKMVTKALPTVKLAIIGDGNEELKKELCTKIEQERLDKRIHVLGFIPYEEVYSIMKQADLFLFLDHEAGWGLAVAEAMACGLPVVGYDNGVLGNVYKGGYRLAPIGDYTGLSQHIVELLKHTTLRKQLAKMAQNEAANHDWNETSKRFSHFVDREIL